MSEDSVNINNSSIVWAPRVGASYSNGWKRLKKYFLELLLITAIGIVIGVPFGIFSDDAVTVGAGAAILGILGFAYGLLVVQPVHYGVSFANLRAARGEKLEIKDMFEAFKNYVNVLLADLPPEKDSSLNVRLEVKKGGKSWSGESIYPSRSSTSYAKLKSS